MEYWTRKSLRMESLHLYIVGARARVVVSKATATDRVNKHVKAIDARTRRLRSSIEHPECPDSLHLHIVNCV